MVQLPNQLPVNRSASVLVEAPSGVTVPDQVYITPVKPGVASFSDGRVIAQHGDYSLVTEASPARSGEVITVYLVGMGTTNPSVSAGQPSPSAEPLARPLVPPVVRVGGSEATILYAGLTPYGIGLFQINLRIPDIGSTTGSSADFIVTQAGQVSNTTRIPIGKEVD